MLLAIVFIVATFVRGFFSRERVKPLTGDDLRAYTGR